MNLVGYTATALSSNDITDTPKDKNVVSGAIVELKTLQGSLVTIYDDAAGTNPETQKTCDSDGQCTFYAETGDYNLEVNGKVNKINLFFNKDKVNDIAAWGDRFVGYFVDGFTYTKADDVAKGIDGKYYSYSGASAYPVAVTAGTVPSAPTYMPVVLSDAESVKNTDGSSAQDAYDATKALLIAQGLSGNYGFFEKGFTYNEVGDVGIDIAGGIYTYAGSDSLPVGVAAETNPVGDVDYYFNSFDVYKIVAVNDEGALRGKQNIKNNNPYSSINPDLHTCWVGYGGHETFPNIIGTIDGSGAHYSGVLGYDNKTDALASAIWHFHGTVLTAADHPTLLGGSFSTIESGSYCTVLGGTGNKLVAGNGTGILASRNSEIVSGSGSGIAFGSSNKITSNGHSNISGGLSNEITAGSDQTLIAGGGLNTAGGVGNTLSGGRLNSLNSDEYATLSGGRENILNGNYAVISGGKSNETEDFSGAVIGGGFDNKSQSGHTVIGGGISNTASGDITTIAGGQSNSASGTQASIYGGRDNIASGDYSVAGGRSNTADGSYSKAEGYQSLSQYGCQAWASGGFSGARGSAQTYKYVSRGITSDSAEANVYVDGVVTSIESPENSVLAIKTQCVASDGTDYAYLEFKALLKRGVGSTGTSPTQSDPVTVVHATAGAVTWSHRITAHPDGRAFIKVTGEPGKTITWVVTSEVTQLVE